MKQIFGPENEHEELVFAVEELLADVQLEIQEAMLIGGITRSELAKRLGCSPANVTQLLSEGANLKLETIARVFHSLGDTCKFHSHLVEVQRQKKVAKKSIQGRKADWNVQPRDASREPHKYEQDDATSQAIMAIAKNAARTPRYHGNSNFSSGQKAA